MASVFSTLNGGGALNKVKTDSVAPLTFKIDPELLAATSGSSGFGSTSSSASFGIAVNVTMRQSIIAQFLPAFNNAIYVTPFGDAPGDMTVTYVINPLCESSTKGKYTFLDTYLKNRLLPSTPSAKRILTFTIGSATFNGSLIDMTANFQTQGMFMAQGTLTFKLWPSNV